VSTDKHENITPDAFDLMAWIESGTVATRQVVIHNNPAMLVEYEALEAEYTAADKAAADAGGDAPMSAVDPHRDIDKRMKAWRKRWEASQATWTVRALDYDDIDATCDPERGGVADPKRPVPPPEKAGQKAAERFMEKVNVWTKGKAAAERERRLYIVSAAVTAIETSKGRLEREPGGEPIATVEAVRALRDRPHGEKWVQKLYGAVNAAMESDVEVPRPTSPERSTTTQD